MPFFEFSQNNSGGSFVYDKKRGLTHYVIIEARDGKDANRLAEDIGIYFNGCDDDGPDCPCCGDRWHPVWDRDKGDKVPSMFGKPIEEAQTYSNFLKKGQKNICVHYLNGEKKWSDPKFER